MLFVFLLAMSLFPAVVFFLCVFFCLDNSFCLTYPPFPHFFIEPRALKKKHFLSKTDVENNHLWRPSLISRFPDANDGDALLRLYFNRAMDRQIQQIKTFRHFFGNLESRLPLAFLNVKNRRLSFAFSGVKANEEEMPARKSRKGVVYIESWS